MVFLFVSISNIQDSMTHLSSFLSVRINTSQELLGVDIVDGNSRLVFIHLASIISEGRNSYEFVDRGKVLASQRDWVFVINTENEFVFDFFFCKIFRSPVNDVVDLELIVPGVDGENLCRDPTGLGDGFVVVKFTFSFNLFSLPILELLFSAFFDCLSCGIVGPRLHLQLVVDHVGDHTVILTEELKVNNIRPVFWS